MPGDTMIPFFLTLAMSVLFVGLLLRIWLVTGLGGLGCTVCILLWLWPDARLHQREPVRG
jgi:hypothetical protein